MENFTLQLRKYVVNNINFTLNENFNAKEQHEIKILPSFQRTVTKLSANDVAVRLSVKVDNSDKSLPFSLEAAVTGFSIWKTGLTTFAADNCSNNQA